MDQLVTDLRFAVRQLLRTPAFTTVAVLTLALGIGVNSALFTVGDAIIRRPRPGVADAASLVWIASTTRERSRPAGISYPVAERVRRGVPALEGVATIRNVPLSLVGAGEPRKVTGQAVSGEYFALLRTPFALGRGIGASDDVTPGAHPVAVLNHATWQSLFAGDSSIVGRAITVNGMALTVIGVTAPGFNGAEHDEEIRALWVPATMLGTLLPEWRGMMTDVASTDVRALGRIRRGAAEAEVNAALARVATLVTSADTSFADGWSLRTFDASAGLRAGGLASLMPIAVLAVIVTSLILLICCANVSNLMLARALSRQREIVTRLSLGASRARIVRQLLTEAIVLGVLASTAGLLIARWGTDLLLAYALPISLDVSVDPRVLGVSLALALATGVLFGLAPALHATRADVAGVLREAGTGGGQHRSRLQGGLVVAQVALSLLMLSLSGLFLRSLDKARRIDVGFDASPRVLAVSFDLGLQRYDSARTAAFTEELLVRVRSLPGVARASTTDLLPLVEWSSMPIAAQPVSGGTPTTARGSRSSVGTDYFGTIGTALQAGRGFTEADAPGAPPVAIVSETFARLHLGGAPALGARVRLGGEGAPWHTVVGIARDAIVAALGSPAFGTVYVPLEQRPSSAITLLVRASGADAAALAPSVRAILRAMDPALPVHRQATLDRVRDETLGERRTGAALLAIFGVLALVLASIGLHGVLLFTVRQRTREIGIRMALGATAGSVITLFVRRGLRLTVIGGAIGIVLALGATQLARSLLFGVSPTDALTLLGVSALFGVVALVACWLPARKAAGVDPVRAMRVE